MKKIWNEIYRDMLAEFISIFVLTAMQTGLTATVVISRKSGHPEGDNFTAAFGCGLVVMVAIYIGGGVSGAHINPAVTSTFAILGKTPWIKVPFYLVAQYVGAFVGAAASTGVYRGALLTYGGDYGDLAVVGIWTTFPAKFLSAPNAMLDSTFSSALLMVMVLAISDPKNMNLPTSISPFFIGLAVSTIGIGYSFNCGNPMNPARDLGPRLWAYVTGHGSDVFMGANDYVWWWIPVLFPHIGCLIGAIIYLVLIEFQHPDDNNDDVVVVVKRDAVIERQTSINTISRYTAQLELPKNETCVPSSLAKDSLILNDRKSLVNAQETDDAATVTRF